MANVVRVRIEVKRKYNDPDKNLKDAIHALRKEIGKDGLLREYRERQTYQSPSEKNRRRRRSSAQKLLVESLRAKILSGEKIREPVALVKKIKLDLIEEKKDRGREKRPSYEE